MNVELINMRNDALELMQQFHKEIGSYPSIEKNLNVCKKFLEYGEVIGIVEKDRIVAMANLYCNNYSTHIAYFNNLFVKEGYRKKGFAKEILQCAINIAKNRKFKVLNLHIISDNYPALSLYQNFLFYDTGKQENGLILLSKKL